MTHVEHALLSLPEHISSPRLLIGFVLFDLYVMFWRTLFVLLSFICWPFCCLSFFDLWLLITLWCLQTFHVLSPVLWCPLRFPHETVFASSLPPVVCRREGSCLIYVIFACLRIVVSKTYYVVLFVLVLSTQCCQFLWNV